MKKLIAKAALLLATTMALPISAHAIEWTWAWTPSDDRSTATFGTLTTNDLVGGSYLITDMKGKWNTEEITLLSSTNAFFYTNNLLLDGSPQLDSGVGFSTATTNIRIFWNEAFDVYVADKSDYIQQVPGEPYRSLASVGTFTANIAPIPEPETYALMLAGLAVVGAAARRRKAK